MAALWFEACGTPHEKNHAKLDLVRPVFVKSDEWTRVIACGVINDETEHDRKF